MNRCFETALFAVGLVGLASGIAGAKPHESTPIVATALQGGADRRGDEATSNLAEPFSISAQARAEMRALETASLMPSATADLAMWSSNGKAPLANAPALKTRVTRGPDSMHRFARGIISRTSSIAMSLTRSAMRFIGTPYVFGGTSPSGFDCSGYTQHVFAMLGIAIPRLADAQFYAGRPTSGGMTTGDLVFFQTYEPGPSHVGIYLGNGRFVHSSSHGVMVSRLGDSYWRSRYLGAKRLAKLN
jgi:cell wall-associated NlpC family hydrolase